MKPRNGGSPAAAGALQTSPQRTSAFPFPPVECKVLNSWQVIKHKCGFECDAFHKFNCEMTDLIIIFVLQLFMSLIQPPRHRHAAFIKCVNLRFCLQDATCRHDCSEFVGFRGDEHAGLGVADRKLQLCSLDLILPHRHSSSSSVRSRLEDKWNKSHRRRRLSEKAVPI